MKLYYKRISTIGERTIAFIIDHLIFTTVFMMVVFYVGITSFEGNGLVLSIVSGIGILLIYDFKDIVNGRSLGKRIFKIGVRCVEDPNEVPSKWRLFLRNIITIIWPIEFLIMIFNPDGARLGDMLAKTIVVKLEKTEDGNNEALEEYKIKYKNKKTISKKNVIITTVTVIGLFVALIVIFIGGIGSVMKNNGAYKTTIAQIEQNEEILHEIGEIKGFGFMPSGSISTANGYGEAQLVIKVKGQKKDIKVFSKLYKEPNSEWQIVEFKILE